MSVHIPFEQLNQAYGSQYPIAFTQPLALLAGDHNDEIAIGRALVWSSNQELLVRLAYPYYYLWYRNLKCSIPKQRFSYIPIYGNTTATYMYTDRISHDQMTVIYIIFLEFESKLIIIQLNARVLFKLFAISS